MKKTPEQQLKLVLTAVLITLLFVVTGLALVHKNHQRELLQKDLKISVLIDEIGEIKEQNEQLHRYFAEEKSDLRQAAEQMAQVEEKVVQLGINSTKQSELQKVLAATNGNLMELVRKKEQTISALEEKNNLITQSAYPGSMPGFLNVLLLGENMGLTDTIMLASVNRVSRKITLISLPRDLFYNGRKLNEYYEKFGIDEMKNVVAAITGIAPDKYMIVDMSAFVEVIDAVGGIDINVVKAITDEQYPGPNHTYALVSFKKGYQHMDGERALKYARSRKSTTDFDRSDRQQQIVAALRQRAEELNLKEDVAKLTDIFNTASQKIKTDITLLDALNYYNDFRTFELSTGNTVSNQNFLYTTYNAAGQYILLPQKKSYVLIQTYVKKLVGAV
jgi:LCP family protein required for cell wall assembly